MLGCRIRRHSPMTLRPSRVLALRSPAVIRQPNVPPLNYGMPGHHASKDQLAIWTPDEHLQLVAFAHMGMAHQYRSSCTSLTHRLCLHIITCILNVFMCQKSARAGTSYLCVKMQLESLCDRADIGSSRDDHSCAMHPSSSTHASVFQQRSSVE